jgi:hypothetical protein
MEGLPEAISRVDAPLVVAEMWLYPLQSQLLHRQKQRDAVI